jgi:hypothetical protein
MKKSNCFNRILPALLLFIFIASNSFAAPKAKQMYYEVKIYRIKDNVQEAAMDTYLKDAFLPALHRAGIPTVGVFKPIEADTAFGKMIYVFIPFKTMEQYAQLADKLGKDQVYAQAGKAFIDAPYNNPPYVRYESILSKAFSNMPEFRVPKFTTPMSERIYDTAVMKVQLRLKPTRRFICSMKEARSGSLKVLVPMLYFMQRLYLEVRCQGLFI